jgi:Domain of unknown function (DUF7024)
MIIITYSKTTADTIEQDIGKPEYSYYFIWKKYLPAMEKVATVIPVRDPLKEVDALYNRYRKEKQQCVFLSFTPPDETPTGLKCPTVCVFAWEFSTIPNESWGGKESSNWVTSLEKAGHALTLSTYAEDVVKQCISPRFPIATVPAPICRKTQGTPGEITVNCDPFELEVNGKVIDSDKFEISFDRVTPIRDEDDEGGAVIEWDSRPVELAFRKENLEATQLLVGFYPAEEWGAWSRTVSPSIILPAAVSGEIELTIEMLAHGENVGREIEIILGSQSKKIPVSGDLKPYTLDFQLDGVADAIDFSGLTITQTTDARDHRTLGLGIKRIAINRPGDTTAGSDAATADVPTAPPPLSRIKGAGVVYTSVLNPADGRKNWEDMVLAFCRAFKDTPDATLILKMTHNDISTFLGVLLQRFTQLPPFKCRVIAIQGYLADEQYSNLINATNYVVNTSYCEGQCLPLMEYMAKGIPAIAPDHTAMRDYISPDNAFIISSNTKPTFWPHDERQYYRALMYEVNWGSITRAFEESYRVLKEEPERYAGMGKNSRDVMENGFSVEAIAPKLEAFLLKASKKRLFPFLRKF